jgi:hypothetical protein
MRRGCRCFIVWAAMMMTIICDPEVLVADLRQRVCDDLLIGRDAKLREDVTLVRDVITHVRVVVGIDRTDPLVHPRAALAGLWPQQRRRKHLFPDRRRSRSSRRA